MSRWGGEVSLITRDLSLSNMILETQNIFHQREKSNQTVAGENNIIFSLLRAGTMRLFWLIPCWGWNIWFLWYLASGRLIWWSFFLNFKCHIVCNFILMRKKGLMRSQIKVSPVYIGVWVQLIGRAEILRTDHKLSLGIWTLAHQNPKIKSKFL